ncbi:hypothetical protein [Amycolatopsis sp. NPDC004378]
MSRADIYLDIINNTADQYWRTEDRLTEAIDNKAPAEVRRGLHRELADLADQLTAMFHSQATQYAKRAQERR